MQGVLQSPPQPVFGRPPAVPWSLQAEFAGWRDDLTGWRPPDGLRHLHVPVIVASLWRRLIDAVREPAVRGDGGAVVVLGVCILQRDAQGAFQAHLWRERAGRLQWDPCPAREIALQAFPWGWIWLDNVRRAAKAELVHHLRSVDAAPADKELERYVQALFGHFRRRLVRHADLRAMRGRVARVLNLDPDALRIARRLMNVMPGLGTPRLSCYNTVVRHLKAFLALERELPQAIALYGALVECPGFARGDWPAQAMRRFLGERGISRATWRLILASGPRLLLPVRDFYRGDADAAMLDYLHVIQDLGLRVEPDSRLIWCLLSQVGNPAFRSARHRPSLARNKERFGHAARMFMRHPDASVADLPDVVEWLRRERPRLDRQQRDAGWGWLVRQAGQWRALRQREIDAEAMAWEVPFEERVVDGFVCRAIRSVRELWDEARAMHHCVDDYAGHCARGEAFVLSVRACEAPDRRVATVMLERTASRWRLGQVRACMNRNPPLRVEAVAARLVADLRAPASCPAAPAGRAVVVGSAPPESVPRRRPPSARYIAEVSWSWSPVHGRREQYFISADRARKRWLLWVRPFDDNYGVWRVSAIAAYCARGALTAAQSALDLLRAYWLHGIREDDLDRYHEVDCGRLLDESELERIARECWGSSVE